MQIAASIDAKKWQGLSLDDPHSADWDAAVDILSARLEGLLDTKETFCKVLTTRTLFASEFSTDAIAEKFYKQFRCGILHQTESGGESKVWSVGPMLSVNGNAITVNRNEVGGQYVINLDAVADAADAALPEKPAFYYAEQGQQNSYTCESCNAFNDILGTYGYCTRCGTRNDLHIFSEKKIPEIRSRINSGGPYESCVKDSVAAFDSFIGQYVEQLVRRIPMTPGRRARLEKVRFHDFQSVERDMRDIFDINIAKDLTEEDRAFAKRMFHRRHVYEHRGGEADQKYINDSGESDVRVGQALRESVETAHRILGIVHKMAVNVHAGFHEIFLVDKIPIGRYEQWKPRPRPKS